MEDVYIYVTGMEIRLRKRQRGLDAFIVFGVPAQMPADVQMNGSNSDAHVQWFSTWRSEQMIMTSFHDVMRISHAIEGENYKRRTQQNLGAVIWVF